METDITRIEKQIKAFELSSLFREELGWDRAAFRFDITLIEPGQRRLGRSSSAAPYVPAFMESHTFTLTAVAQKRGMIVFVCSPMPDGTIPNTPLRFRLQHKLSKISRENLLVFADADNTKQVWQWVCREIASPVQICEHTFDLPYESRALAQRLLRIAIGIEEEEAGRITLTEVVQRVYAAFYNLRERKSRAPYRRTRLADYDFAYFEDGLRAWLEYAYSRPRLGRREEQHIARAAQKGNAAAKQRFIEANLYLAAEVAWLILQQGKARMEMLPDMIQEGNIGLIRAVEGYDPQRGYRFQTYARWPLQRDILRAIDDWPHVIDLPAYVHYWLAQIKPQYALEKDRLWQCLGREPSEEEMALRLGLTRQEKARLFLMQDQACSLHAPELAPSLHKIVDENKAHNPFVFLMIGVRRVALLQSLSELKPREAETLWLRYGMDGEAPRTLEEVGRELEVTRERVRQIEAAALSELRKWSRAYRLRGL